MQFQPNRRNWQAGNILAQLMNNPIKLSILALLLILIGSAFPASLGVVLDNSLYVRKNLVDTSTHPVNYGGGLSVDLEKIGSTNLSLFSDFGVSNTFFDTSHKNFEIRTLYLDIPVISNLDAKIGRQSIYDLFSKNVCLDGGTIEYNINKEVRFHGYAGEPIPSRYGKPLVRHNLNLLQGGFGTDVALAPATLIGFQVADIPDTSGTSGRIPFGGYIESRFGKFLGLKADAAYDLAFDKMEHYSLDLSGRPTSRLQWRVNLLGEDQAIDSTDAYERLVLGKYTNLSLQIGYNDRRNYVRGYYSVRALGNGSDNLAGISASFMNIFLGLDGGSGVSGSSVKVSAGYARDILQSVRSGAAITYYTFKLSQNPSQEHSLTGRVYANWLIPALGIVLSPEIQVLRNEYYRRDVRFLLNAQYQFFSFWKS
jgi:hypothetical protein